jgi:predicted MFS family arabinose efflux permease
MQRMTSTAQGPRPLAIAVAGLLSLAIAMGIGRFAFTPLLPMMLADGLVDLAGGSTLATANYLGYWIGAMACALQPALWRRWPRAPVLVHASVVRAGLLATALLTLAMAWPSAALWVGWRLAAGIVSALVFVFVSGWCLARLTALGAPALAGLMYAGPGLGITVSGLAGTAMVAAGVSAAAAWASLAALALLLSAFAWPQLRGSVSPPPPPAAGAAGPRRTAVGLFVLAYGLAGFGYIVTATFLPVIARQSLAGSVWLDLFWPLFGVGVSAGALLTLKLPMHWDRRGLLLAGYLLQALGVLLGLAWPTRAGFACGSLLLGLPFTAITLFAMQEARRLSPHNAAALIGLLTAAYGLGQIAGPLLVATLVQRSGDAATGFAWSLQSAAAALLLGAGLFGWLMHHERPAPLR